MSADARAKFLSAVEMGHVEEVKAALANGMDVNTRTVMLDVTREEAAELQNSGAGIFIDETRHTVHLEDGGWCPAYFVKSCLLYTSPSPRDRG